MRVISIVVLAVCFIGVTSAGSIEKRQTYTQKLIAMVKEAIENGTIDQLPSNIKLLGNNSIIYDSDTGIMIFRSKRSTNPLELINDLGNIGADPAKFVEDFLKVLAEMALSQGRRKRDLFGDLQKFGEAVQEKGQEAFENILSENPIFQSISDQFDDDSEETSTGKW